jgi:hypothetical protein
MSTSEDPEQHLHAHPGSLIPPISLDTEHAGNPITGARAWSTLLDALVASTRQ